MKATAIFGWLFAGISVALFATGHLLFFDVLWPLVQLRHDQEIAVGAWIVGALLSATTLGWCRRRGFLTGCCSDCIP